MGKGFFQDDNGNNSILRVGWFLTLVSYLFVWCYVVIFEGEWMPFEVNDLIIFGTLFAGKIAQKLIENK